MISKTLAIAPSTLTELVEESEASALLIDALLLALLPDGLSLDNSKSVS